MSDYAWSDIRSLDHEGPYEVGRCCDGLLHVYTRDGTPVAQIHETIGGHPTPAAEVAKIIVRALNAAREARMEEAGHIPTVMTTES